MSAVMGADYWVTKQRHIDIPSLYRAHGRYRYNQAGTNWRAVVAFLFSLVPNIPGLAASVNPSLEESVGGMKYIWDMFYIWGFTSAFITYIILSYFFPEQATLIPASIYEDPDVIDAVEYDHEEVPTLDGCEKGEKDRVGVANYDV